MTEPTAVGETRKLLRAEASAAVTDLGWRYVLGQLRTVVPVTSLAQAAQAAAVAVFAAGPDADQSLTLDARRDSLVLSLQAAEAAWVTAREARLAQEISAAIANIGLATTAGLAATSARSVQVLEIAIDALDIAVIRPFWLAVLGYTSEPGQDGPEDAIVDPVGQGPAVWFQQMDEPRPQRNRIHLDVSVPHDEAAARIAATVAAGGELLDDEEAPAFWLLADPEGNEACITTWQGRDPVS
jgi:4a-hydroxytetrahydrobiopterin dehydratase